MIVAWQTQANVFCIVLKIFYIFYIEKIYLKYLIVEDEIKS